MCLNWGCIPTKALLRSAEVLELCRRAGEFGVTAADVSFDFAAIIERSRQVAAKISKGVAYLFRKNQVTHVTGTARLVGAGVVEVDEPTAPSTSSGRRTSWSPPAPGRGRCPGSSSTASASSPTARP